MAPRNPRKRLEELIADELLGLLPRDAAQRSAFASDLLDVIAEATQADPSLLEALSGSIPQGEK